MVSRLKLGGGLLGQKLLTLQSPCGQTWPAPQQMLSRCLFLSLGEYPFSKVFPNPSRYLPGSGLGHNNAGDWEGASSPPGRQRHEGPTTIQGHYCHTQRGALTSDPESAGKAAQWQGRLSWAL